MENIEMRHGAAAELVNDVLSPGLCSGCGACVGYCPYIKTFGERVAVIHDCKICKGTCYRICPRTFTPYHTLREETFDLNELDPVFGIYDSIYFARACEVSVRSRGQYGGVVTALSTFALNQGTIDSILMTGGSFVKSKPSIVSSIGGILACAGSKYTSVPTLSMFQEAVKKGYQKIGVVGRPCQVTASRKMQKVPEINGQNISLVIGLFCMGSLLPDFYQFIREKKLDKYDRMDIPNDIKFQGTAGEAVIPYEEIRNFIRNACLSCYDPLSELADISVGSTEYDPGWNTLIIRTAGGTDLVSKAVANGIIEIKPYPKKRLHRLAEAVFSKKKRVLEMPESAYLELPDKEREYFLAAGGDY